MPVLTDYSQLAISCALVHQEDMKKDMDPKKMRDIIRHTVLKSILSYKAEYSKYGELVLCADSKPSWRKGVFPYYKAHRKKNREESDIDWDTILRFVDALKSDLINVFGYKVVEAKGAEGDDCIGIITKYTQTQVTTSDNPLDELTGEPPKVIVLSSDHDFKQLLKYKNVKQWSMMQKKWVTNDDPNFLKIKIITGDSGDGIPSVLMEDDFLVNGVGRAKSVTQKVKDHYLNLDNLTEEELARYNRNKVLIDFDECPQSIQDKIIESYLQPVVKTKKQDVFNYLVQHRCKQLVDRIQEF